MNRYLLILALVFAGSLYAGEYADEVKNLGDKNLRPGALESLAKAGDEAFEDLLDGLKQDPAEEGVDAGEAAARSARRMDCARLLGALGDTRASGELAQLLAKQAVESPSHSQFGATCASALGRLWSDKPDSAERKSVVDALKLHAGNPALDVALHWGALHGLAHLKAGAEVAAPFVSNTEALPLLRAAAIEVVVATKHSASADALLDIWETQRLGPKNDEGNRTGAQSRDYTLPLGMQALFGLAKMGDKRAVPGLVDVATLNEFSNYNSLRDEAVRAMKSDALQAGAITTLVETFKDVNKPTQRSRAAQALGEFGAPGVTAFLDVADDAAPEAAEGQPAHPEDYYKKQVDANLSSLRGQDALNAFVDAYGKLPADNKELRQKIVDHLLNNRTTLKDKSLNVFRTAGDDESLEAPKRAQAINAWAEAKGKEAFEDLSRWVKSEDGVIRAQAVQNLGRNYIPLAKSRPLLEATLADKAEDFEKARENALQGLQRGDDKDLLPLFLDALDPEKEPSPKVRNAALTAIDAYRRTAGIDDDKVYDAIKARVTDTDADVRATAVRVASTTAQRMGNKTAAVEIIENAVQDESKEVRLEGYGRVSLVQGDIDAGKVVRAALLEEERDVKGRALSALALLSADAFGDDTAQKQRVVDLALSLIDDRLHEKSAQTLLGKIGTGAMFNYASGKVRERIEAATSKEPKDYARVPALIRALIEIQDLTYFKKVEELADVPNVELRRACVEYIEAFGTKSDIPFLRTLVDKSDAASPQLRPRIEDAIKKLESK
ncbi:MAG: HEAT repeat domain-containing protein [Planctomycetes bacterium]|nr:HEAT repeat domain-containing protein [Planctomycetota bacterium]